MVNRRSVLKISAATVAGVLVKVPVSGLNLSPGKGHMPFHRAVFDDRFVESQAFAIQLETLGAVVSAISGDVAKLWYGDLRGHLSKHRAPVAGLTDRPALFCLEELARDVGMRVIFRADHMIHQSWPTEHVAVGPASLVAVTLNLPREAAFGRKMARLFSQFDINEPGDMAAQKRTGPFSPENKTALVSWVIA